MIHLLLGGLGRVNGTRSRSGRRSDDSEPSPTTKMGDREKKTNGAATGYGGLKKLPGGRVRGRRRGRGQRGLPAKGSSVTRDEDEGAMVVKVKTATARLAQGSKRQGAVKWGAMMMGRSSGESRGRRGAQALEANAGPGWGSAESFQAIATRHHQQNHHQSRPVHPAVLQAPPRAPVPIHPGLQGSELQGCVSAWGDPPKPTPRLLLGDAQTNSSYVSGVPPGPSGRTPTLPWPDLPWWPPLVALDDPVKAPRAHARKTRRQMRSRAFARRSRH